MEDNVPTNTHLDNIRTCERHDGRAGWWLGIGRGGLREVENADRRVSGNL